MNNAGDSVLKLQTKTCLIKYSCLGENCKKETQLLPTAAAPNWCNFISSVTPAGSDCKSSGLIIVINWTVSHEQDYLPLLFATTRDFRHPASNGPFCSGYCDDYGTHGQKDACFFLSVPGRIWDRRWTEGETKLEEEMEWWVWEMQRRKHCDKSDVSQRWA